MESFSGNTLSLPPVAITIQKAHSSSPPRNTYLPRSSRPQATNRCKNTTPNDQVFGCNLFTSNNLPFEQTIRAGVECRGIGLHSGAPVNLRILPAPAGTGIVFRRVDLDGFEIEAVGRNVAKVSYATSLQKKGVLISTTEHLLSACIGIGLDNAIVELDNLELPILDGSAKPFVELILQAGLKQQRKRRAYLKILREIEVREGNKFIAAYPADGYSVAYKINFAAPIGEQSF